MSTFDRRNVTPRRTPVPAYASGTAAATVGTLGKAVSVLLVILLIAALTAAGFALESAKSRRVKQETYDTAIEMIRQKDYIKAIAGLRQLSDSDFPDLQALENYVWAMWDYDNGNYVRAAIYLESCKDAILAHDEFGTADALLEALEPLADAQRQENGAEVLST